MPPAKRAPRRRRLEETSTFPIRNAIFPFVSHGRWRFRPALRRAAAAGAAASRAGARAPTQPRPPRARARGFFRFRNAPARSQNGFAANPWRRIRPRARNKRKPRPKEAGEGARGPRTPSNVLAVRKLPADGPPPRAPCTEARANAAGNGVLITARVGGEDSARCCVWMCFAHARTRRGRISAHVTRQEIFDAAHRTGGPAATRNPTGGGR